MNNSLPFIMSFLCLTQSWNFITWWFFLNLNLQNLGILWRFWCVTNHWPCETGAGCVVCHNSLIVLTAGCSLVISLRLWKINHKICCQTSARSNHQKVLSAVNNVLDWDLNMNSQQAKHHGLPITRNTTTHYYQNLNPNFFRPSQSSEE